MRQDHEEAPPPRTSGQAVWSLVLGLLSFGCLFLTGIPALILGLLGLRSIGRSNGRLKGTGLAVFGIITGAAGTLLGALITVFGTWVGFQVKSEFDNAENLKRIGIAMHTYHDAMAMLPPQVLTDRLGNPFDKDAKPTLSWRVALLPYLGEDKLFKQFKLDEPWDGPNNQLLLAKMPKVYKHPAMDPGDPTLTYYQVFVSSQPPGGTAMQAPFLGRASTRIPASFPDGTSNTILVAEAAKPVPWTKPEDMPFDGSGPLPELGGRFPQYFLAVFADGKVRRVNKAAKPESLKLLICPNDGRVIPADAILGDVK